MILPTENVFVVIKLDYAERRLGVWAEAENFNWTHCTRKPIGELEVSWETKKVLVNVYLVLEGHFEKVAIH